MTKIRSSTPRRSPFREGGPVKDATARVWQLLTASSRRAWSNPDLRLQVAIGIVMLLTASRVVCWLPYGFTPDNGNSFAPEFPIHTSPLQLAFPWVSLFDGGYPNPAMQGFLNAIPTYAFSAIGLSTWVGDIAFLLVLYTVGSWLAANAAGELLPALRKHWWLLAIVGVAYQLAPPLMYGLQDSAAFGLNVGLFWGPPLLCLSLLRFERDRRVIWGVLTGLGSLLAFSSDIPIFLLVMLLVIFVWRAHQFGAVWKTLARALEAVAWIAVFNAWWLVTEFTYRTSLLGNLASNTPGQGLFANHFAGTIIFDWTYPPVLALPSLGGTISILALTAVAAVTYLGLLQARFARGGFVLGFSFLLIVLIENGYSAPTGHFYYSALLAFPFLNLYRNPEHFTQTFILLFSTLFGAGVLELSGAASRAFGILRGGIAAWTTMGRMRRRFRWIPSKAGDGVVAVCCIALLCIASLPLITGAVVVNTRYNGVAVTPVPGAIHGVKVPAYYHEAKTWMSSEYPGRTSMIYPMPATWISADANLSWGYQGTSAVYSTLLPTPLVLNSAGSLERTSFPAIQDVYEFAAQGGVPGTPTMVPTNGSIYVWPGYVNDSVNAADPSSPFGNLIWTLALDTNYGTNGHQFGLTVPSRHSSNGTLVVNFTSSISGTLSFAWGTNASIIGWYPTPVVAQEDGSLVVPLGVPPPFNYDPSVLSTGDFQNATRFLFAFNPENPTEGGFGRIQVSAASIYSVDPGGLPFYIESLGAGLVVADSSFRAAHSDPLQNLTSYARFLSSLSPVSKQVFGNLSVYVLPKYLPAVAGVYNYNVATSSALAWSERTSNCPVFLSDNGRVPPPTVGLGGSNCDGPSLDVEKANPASYNVRVETAKPFLLVLLQNFDSEWSADVGSRPLAHLEVNGFANAWWVNATGSLTVQITYGPVKTLYGVVIISVVIGAGLFLASVPQLRRRLSGLMTPRRAKERLSDDSPDPLAGKPPASTVGRVVTESPRGGELPTQRR